jgi:hypothetical protein
MPLVGFDPKISADERPETYALVRMAAGTGNRFIYHFRKYVKMLNIE